MLKIQDVSVRFSGSTILDHVDLTLEHGIYALLGENGAGKTTLIRVLTTLLKPNEGKILYDGQDIGMLGEVYREKLGYMPQYAFYYPDFTADEFLNYMCVLKGVSRRQQKERIDRLLAEVNLSKERKKKIGKFSGGMRQRLGIAQVMLNDPEIIILDEPTAGLDPSERIRFRNLISEVAKNKIVILATHIVQDIELIANHVVLLHKGKVLVSDRPEGLLETVKGKVVQLEASEAEAQKISKTYTVSNMMYEGAWTKIRIVLDDQNGAPENSRAAVPNLEEAFLYYIRRQERAYDKV